MSLIPQYSTTAAPLNQKVINEFSDFPEPMLPDTQYFIGSAVVMPDILPASWDNLPASIEFAGNVVSSKISYNGTQDLFKSTNPTRFRIVDVLLDAPNARMYNLVDTTGVSIVNLITASIVNCAELGYINVFGFFGTVMNFANVDQGFTLGPKVQVLGLDSVAATSTKVDFVYCDITTASIPTFDMQVHTLTAPAGAIGLKGLANSANIAAGAIASLDKCKFFGGMTPIDGIGEDDIRFSYSSNTGIPDSTISANPILTTPTRIPPGALVQNTWYKVNQGNWAASIASRVTVTADGDVINELENDIRIQFNGFITLEKVGGGQNYIEARLVYDDDPDDAQSIATTNGTENSAPTSVPLTGLFLLPPQKGVSIWVRNTEGTSKIDATAAKFTLLRVL